MSDLTTFRDHCRRMSTAKHAPGCPALTRPCEPPWRWDDEATKWIRPPCTCGLTDADRTLFAALAGQVDAYLAGDLGGLDAAPTDQDQPLFADDQEGRPT